MTEGDRVLAEINDVEGRVVVLRARIWEEKVTRDHPELAHHVQDVVITVVAPDHVAPDPRAARWRYDRCGVGPSRWLLVVVSFEQDPARIITAIATRKGPKGWQP